MDATLDISVVVPLYNEEESLPELVEWIDRVARGDQVRSQLRQIRRLVLRFR